MKAPFRSILCPTDLSAVGNTAVPVAYLLAAKGGVVHLLHVDAPPKGNPLYPDARPTDAPSAAQLADTRKAERAKLEGLVPADAAARGVETKIDFAEGEDIALVIEAAAKGRGAEVIVLGSHGRWGVSRILHGEPVSTRLLHRKDLDVIVVHTDRP